MPVTSIVAFDSKEFNIPGRVRDFFCPLGIGLEILDKDRFNASYRAAVRELRDRNGIRQKRTVFDSSTLQRLLGG